jgi:thiol-disulfide isomerase/thioredoxin
MASKSSTILNVDSESKIPDLEKLLKSKTIIIIFVNASWCPHCVKFKKDIWGPMCKKSAIHNRVSINADLMGKTSLANANYKYLPSILVINEKGKPEEFQTPEGEVTNAMPTPKTLNDMVRVVNVPLKPMSKEQEQELEEEKETRSNTNPIPITPNQSNQSNQANEGKMVYEGNTVKRNIYTPEGKIYEPQRGGGVEGGALLRSLVAYARGFHLQVKTTRKRKSTARKTRRKYRTKK